LLKGWTRRREQTSKIRGRRHAWVSWAAALATVALVMPGIGPLVAAGPLAAELGELAGHVAGSLAAVLTSAGLPHERAETLQREVARGAVLLGVHIAAPDVAGVRESLSAAGATAIEIVTWP